MSWLHKKSISTEVKAKSQGHIQLKNKTVVNGKVGQGQSGSSSHETQYKWNAYLQLAFILDKQPFLDVKNVDISKHASFFPINQKVTQQCHES